MTKSNAKSEGKRAQHALAREATENRAQATTRAAHTVSRARGHVRPTSDALTEQPHVFVCGDHVALDPAVLDSLADAIPDSNTVREMTDIFAALGDGTRLRILYALSITDLCVDDLSTIIGITPSAVSHQLRLLRTLRLVRKRRHGRHAIYSLDDDHVLHILREGMEHVKHD